MNCEQMVEMSRCNLPGIMEVTAHCVWPCSNDSIQHIKYRIFPKGLCCTTDPGARGEGKRWVESERERNRERHLEPEGTNK